MSSIATPVSATVLLTPPTVPTAAVPTEPTATIEELTFTPVTIFHSFGRNGSPCAPKRVTKEDLSTMTGSEANRAKQLIGILSGAVAENIAYIAVEKVGAVDKYTLVTPQGQILTHNSKIIATATFKTVYPTDFVNRKFAWLKMTRKEGDTPAKVGIERELKNLEILEKIDGFIKPYLFTVHKVADVYHYIIIDELMIDLVDYFPKITTLAQKDSLTYSLFTHMKMLEEHNLVHRDIKLDNILIRESEIDEKSGKELKEQKEQEEGEKVCTAVLADVESVCYTTDDVLGQPRGTPDYLAPEMMTHGRASHKSDIWALGIVLYYIWSGGKKPKWFQIPESSSSVEQIRIAIAKFRPFDLDWLSIEDRNVRELIKKMLSLDPDERPTGTRLFEAGQVYPEKTTEV